MKKLIVLAAAFGLFAVANVNAQSDVKVVTPSATSVTSAAHESADVAPGVTATSSTKETTAAQSCCKGKETSCCKNKSAKAEACKDGSSKASCCSKNKSEAKAEGKSESKSAVKE